MCYLVRIIYVTCADKMEKKAALIVMNALDAAVPPLQNELCPDVLALLFPEIWMF